MSLREQPAHVALPGHLQIQWDLWKLREAKSDQLLRFELQVAPPGGETFRQDAPDCVANLK
jgi:hypothetical protein